MKLPQHIKVCLKHNLFSLTDLNRIKAKKNISMFLYFLYKNDMLLYVFKLWETLPYERDKNYFKTYLNYLDNVTPYNYFHVFRVSKKCTKAQYEQITYLIDEYYNFLHQEATISPLLKATLDTPFSYKHSISGKYRMCFIWKNSKPQKRHIPLVPNE